MNLFVGSFSTGPGVLLGLALLVMVLTFLGPLILPAPTDWRSGERIIRLTDWGSSIAGVLAGIGFLFIESGNGPIYMMKYRYYMAGLCFAFAGFRGFRNTKSWY